MFADAAGRVFDHPFLEPAARIGSESLPVPEDAWIPLPPGAKVAVLPGRAPIGIDAATGAAEPFDGGNIGGTRIRANAVGAILPPAFVRTHIPAYAKRTIAPALSQWAYTAVALRGNRTYAAAFRLDARTRWDPRHFTEAALRRAAALRAREFPGNRLIAQVTKCALDYACVTSQNILLRRNEGALPVSVTCNAECLGCLSLVPAGGAPSSHERVRRLPTATEIADVATAHLKRARRPMVSFGQGCEGEPLLAAPLIEEAIREIRTRTKRGRINMNTNGSLPAAALRLIDAGLDHIRVSLNSARASLYAGYYRPANFRFQDVVASIRAASSGGVTTTLNLLTFPGVTDRDAEIDALAALVALAKVDLVQIRNLAIDPDLYLSVAGKPAPALGIRELLRRIARARPTVRFGCFNLSHGDAP
jgi:pyruvate-formate lyase-activating enzyme